MGEAAKLPAESITLELPKLGVGGAHSSSEGLERAWSQGALAKKKQRQKQTELIGRTTPYDRTSDWRAEPARGTLAGESSLAETKARSESQTREALPLL